MLNKNILLVIESTNLALSLTKMFKYFPMNIDLCIKKFRKEKYNLSEYDMILIEDVLFDFQMHDLILKAQKQSKVAFVMTGREDVYTDDDESKLHTAFLKKPVTQESVFQLLISLFEDLPILT